MEKLGKVTQKLCSFYVSDWHLVTMLLPYINEKLNEKANIITILENDIEENIKTILTRVNLKNEDKILNIDWKNSNGKKYVEVAQKLTELLKKEEKNIILINGVKNYIDAVNYNVEKTLENFVNKGKNVNIKIINCYEVTEFNGNITEILDKHNKILNTAGEKEIEEVFEGYRKNVDEQNKIAL